ncbi:hypothetical protein B0H21DRAFT_752328 [Amylocystis lapponica]|nr:hypothetical protein B0H21DRAFT_752328 [Amylocystis lapponica]
MAICDLPVELLLEILSLALDKHSSPTDVLCVNKAFAQLSQRILHAELHFQSIRQLILFGEQTTELACAPKTVSVTLAGGTANFNVFLHLAAALRRCGGKPIATDRGAEQTAQVSLEQLTLCLHSHTRNPNLQYIYEALSLASPRSFTWTGPDPDHHFSTAIVPAATFYLFRAVRAWAHVEHITLTNLSFPSDDLGLHGPLLSSAPLLPLIPSLRTLYLGQATFLPPSAVALMVCHPDQRCLELVRLVDAYGESIWGQRIRRKDVEKAAGSLNVRKRDALVAQVRRLVRCEAKTERIMGGDRVEGLLILE